MDFVERLGSTTDELSNPLVDKDLQCRADSRKLKAPTPPGPYKCGVVWTYPEPRPMTARPVGSQPVKPLMTKRLDDMDCVISKMLDLQDRMLLVLESFVQNKVLMLRPKKRVVKKTEPKKKSRFSKVRKTPAKKKKVVKRH